MTFAKASSLTVGFIAAFGLGVWAGPVIMRTSSPDLQPRAEMPAAPAAPAPDKAAAAVTPAPVRAAAPTVNVTTPALQQRLKPILQEGTDMNKAAHGFRSAEQFATVAFASHNTQVPFVVLKHRVLNEGKTLTSAIRESQPAIHAAIEVERARAEARSTIASIGS